MNAAILAIRTPVVAVTKQAPAQESSQNATTSADSAASASDARGFAGALDRATAKQGRKVDSSKPGTGKRSGDALPPSGSVAPPAAATPAVTTPGAVPALPAQLLIPNDAPAAASLDDGDEDASDGAAAAATTAATTGIAGTAVPGDALCSAPAVGPDAAPASGTGSPQNAVAAHRAVFPDTTTDLSATAADAAAMPSEAASTAASAPAQSSGGSDVAAAAALAAKSSAATASIGGARATPSAVSGARLQSLASGTGAAGSRTAAQSTPSSVPSAASADDTAAAAQTPLASSALINLALSEGSDATGSAASALQAASAAASSPPPAADATAAAASPFSTLQISMMPTAGTGAASSATAPGASAAVGSLGSGGDTHGRNGAGDFGSDAGSGSLANGDGAAALQQLSTGRASSSSDAAPVPTVSVHADVDSADFPQGVADKVSLAVDNGWSSAKISVNPPQLGPIELQIAVQGGHAQIAMSTHSAVTREALESSAPKLRDLLNSQGFTQVSVDVSQRSFQERSAPELPYGRASGGVRETAPVASSSTRVSRAPLGMLDTYA